MDFSDWLPALFGVGGTLLGASIGARASLKATKQQLEQQREVTQQTFLEQRRRDSSDAARALANAYAATRDALTYPMPANEKERSRDIVARVWLTEHKRIIRDQFHLIVSDSHRERLRIIAQALTEYEWYAGYTNSTKIEVMRELAQHGWEVTTAYQRGSTETLPDLPEVYAEVERERAHVADYRFLMYDEKPPTPPNEG